MSQSSGEESKENGCSVVDELVGPTDTRSMLKTMKFEDIYSKPETKMAINNAFVYQMMKFQEKKAKENSSPMHLRSLPSSPSVGQSGDEPVEGASGGGGAEVVDLGQACLDEIMERWDRNKKEAKRQKISDPNDSEESLGLSDADSDEDEFRRYTVPQWELKTKLCKLHFKKIQELTSAEVGSLCEDVLPELLKIIQGKIPCKRDEIFKTCGISKAPLRAITVGRQFNGLQNDAVMRVLCDWFHTLFKPEEIKGDMLHYAANVLAPEAIIRIFANVNNIPIDLAEKELRFEGSFDGYLPEELVQYVEANEHLLKAPEPKKKQSKLTYSTGSKKY